MNSESLERIEDKLRSLVAAKLKLPPENVPMDAPIVAELGLDSIEVIQFMLEVEEVFPEFLFAASAESEVRTLRELALRLQEKS